MENKNMTAVEWLIEKQLDAGIGLPKIWRDQAKAMEKEQIMHAYGQGVADEAGEILDVTTDSEYYYNKIYKSK